jgi:hypothetical protein
MPTLTPLTDAIEYSLTIMKAEMKEGIAEGKFTESYERISSPLIEAALKPMAHEMDLLETKVLPMNLARELEAAFATAVITAMGTWSGPKNVEEYKEVVIAFIENVANRALSGLTEDRILCINHPVAETATPHPSRN